MPPTEDRHHLGESSRLPESADKALPSQQDSQASTHQGPKGMASPPRELAEGESSTIHSPTLSEEAAILKEDPREAIYLGDPVEDSGTTSKPTRQTSDLPSAPRVERERSPSRRRRRRRHDQPSDLAKNPKLMLVVPREWGMTVVQVMDRGDTHLRAIYHSSSGRNPMAKISRFAELVLYR
ncbi:MAG: hypothetical protein AB2693_16295 [Candidatus Thiodiazotropha sp.]